MRDRVTLKGQVIAEIVAANPGGVLKAVEYDNFGAIKRVEWHHPTLDDDEGLTPIETAPLPGEREMTTAADRWVSRDETEERALVEHLGGIPWWEAPIPPLDHDCTPQSRALLQDIDRCACGALRFRHGPGSGFWGERNSRKGRPADVRAAGKYEIKRERGSRLWGPRKRRLRA